MTGSPCVSHFTVPERVDLVKLPAVSKSSTGDYIPRTLSGSFSSLLSLRGRILRETFRAFAPHLFIVDHQVLGLKGEALDILREARERGTRTILGLRDIIGSPDVVRKSWNSPACRWALSEGYDRICVYGDPEVFDARLEYSVPDRLRERFEFTGYIVRPSKSKRRRAFPSLKRRVLVTMGGGQDGAERIATYLEAMALGPAAWETTILGGPLLESRALRQLKHRAREIGQIEIKRFHSDLPSLLQESSAVVCMAGYNTSAEVLQSGRAAVFLPRSFPRQEQRIRAERLSHRGLARTAVNPTPRELRELVQGALTTPPRSDALPNMHGCRRLCEIAEELLVGSTKQLRQGA